MISSEIGTATTLIIIANETGLVVPPSDTKSLRKGIDYLWNSLNLEEEMDHIAELRYLLHFTTMKMVDSYVDLYKNLLTKANSY